MNVMSSFKEQYNKTIAPALARELHAKGRMAVPRIAKIVLNVGMGAAASDPKLPETIEKTLTRITGQRPVKTLARKSIASFKIREGMPIGMMVTLHGQRMWDFFEKLVRVTLPRVRDFRGIALSTVDGRGNLSIGFREHVAFPEIRSDEVDKIHGVQITIVSTAGTRDRGLALFRAFGFPFQADSQQPQAASRWRRMKSFA